MLEEVVASPDSLQPVSECLDEPAEVREAQILMMAPTQPFQEKPSVHAIRPPQGGRRNLGLPSLHSRGGASATVPDLRAGR